MQNIKKKTIRELPIVELMGYKVVKVLIYIGKEIDVVNL
jgi:hypothetical protein